MVCFLHSAGAFREVLQNLPRYDWLPAHFSRVWRQWHSLKRLAFLQIAAEVAAPLSQAKKVTMVSTGKGDVGASKLTGEVLDVVEKMPLLVQNLTGVDISKVPNHLSCVTAQPVQLLGEKVRGEHGFITLVVGGRDAVSWLTITFSSLFSLWNFRRGVCERRKVTLHISQQDEKNKTKCHRRLN